MFPILGVTKVTKTYEDYPHPVFEKFFMLRFEVFQFMGRGGRRKAPCYAFLLPPKPLETR